MLCASLSAYNYNLPAAESIKCIAELNCGMKKYFLIRLLAANALHTYLCKRSLNVAIFVLPFAIDARRINKYEAINGSLSKSSDRNLIKSSSSREWNFIKQLQA